MATKKKLRIGAINWDAFMSGDAYFASHAMDSLDNEKYSSRLPFYIQKKDGKHSVPIRSLADYERELAYAIEGGIDFFAYCWYPDSKEKRNIWKDDERYAFLHNYYHELNYSRKLYQQSSLKEKIGMCAIIFCIISYSKSDFDLLFDAMQENYYVKVNGKPLLIVFDKYDVNFIELVRGLANERGITPYIAFTDTNTSVDKNTDYTYCDAVTAYACGGSASSFSEFTSRVRADNDNRTEYDISVIPLMSMGWNPSPRVDRPKPWIKYRDVPFVSKPNETELDEAFADLVNFIDSCSYADTGCAVVFAWNEFEEGGYLCPTLREDGTAEDSLLKSFAKAKKKYTTE